MKPVPIPQPDTKHPTDGNRSRLALSVLAAVGVVSGAVTLLTPAAADVTRTEARLPLCIANRCW